MARIPVEKKSSGSSWGWILGLLALALIVWGIWEAFDNDQGDTGLATMTEDQTLEAEEQTAGTTTGQEPAGGAAGDMAGAEGEELPIAQIVQQPDQFVGQTVSGEAEVANVPFDQGFWIEHQGERILVVLDQGANQAIDLQPGQRLQLDNATVYSDPQQLPSDLSPEAMDQLQREDVFLSATDVQVLAG